MPLKDTLKKYIVHNGSSEVLDSQNDPSNIKVHSLTSSTASLLANFHLHSNTSLDSKINADDGRADKASKNTRPPAEVPNANPLKSNESLQSVDIFERNVQTDMTSSHNNSTQTSNSPISISISPIAIRNSISPITIRASASACTNNSFSPPTLSQRNSFVLSDSRPRHLISEDFTSPILDSTVELINSDNFNETDLLEVSTDNSICKNLLKTYSQNSLAGYSGAANNVSNRKSFSNTMSPSNTVCTCSNNSSINNTIPIPMPGSNTSSIAPDEVEQPLLSKSKRKSISFYSYLDLINYEKSLNNNECPKHGHNLYSNNILTRRPTLQGTIADNAAKIDENLELSSKYPNDSSAIYEDENADDVTTAKDISVTDDSSNCPHAVTAGAGCDHLSENSDDNIQPWNPLLNRNASNCSGTRSRHQSIVDEMASLKSCATNNTYFEEELESFPLSNSNSNSNSINNVTEPLINVCTANDYLCSKAKELRKTLSVPNNNIKHTITNTKTTAS